MATKLQFMSELAVQTTEQLTQSNENWTSFLDSAAWLYKYPFHEQVLIHAQRPDEKACAPIELWNNTFHRWVNKGAKGICVAARNLPELVIDELWRNNPAVKQATQSGLALEYWIQYGQQIGIHNCGS